MCSHQPILSSLFFFNDTATTEIYTLSLHDALPISLAPDATGIDLRPAVREELLLAVPRWVVCRDDCRGLCPRCGTDLRSEEHTSELQSRSDLVCRLLLEKKKKGPTTRA